MQSRDCLPEHAWVADPTDMLDLSRHRVAQKEQSHDGREIGSRQTLAENCSGDDERTNHNCASEILSGRIHQEGICGETKMTK
jgi:hypothetical protein